VFNRGFGPMFPVRVLVGLVREFFKLSTLDSLFVDSPLSSLGVRQVHYSKGLLSSTPNSFMTLHRTHTHTHAPPSLRT